MSLGVLAIHSYAWITIWFKKNHFRSDYAKVTEVPAYSIGQDLNRPMSYYLAYVLYLFTMDPKTLRGTVNYVPWIHGYPYIPLLWDMEASRPLLPSISRNNPYLSVVWWCLCLVYKRPKSMHLPTTSNGLSSKSLD